MAEILEFRQQAKAAARAARRRRKSADGDASGGAKGEVIIFPGIRVDYGHVETALSRMSADTEAKQSRSSGKSRRKRSKG